MEDESSKLTAMICTLLHLPERIAFYSEFEQNSSFPFTWLAFVRDVIPLCSVAFDHLLLREPLNLCSILHSETLSDPGRYIPNLGESIANLGPLLEQRLQPLPGLDQYALPKINIAIKNIPKVTQASPSRDVPHKKQKVEKHSGSNPPLKIVLKF